MKKLFIILSVFIFSIFSISSVLAGNCDYNDGTISSELKDCLIGSPLVGSEAKIIGGDGFQQTINTWTKNISLYLGIGAVLGIVYGSFMMTISAGEDEKINKSKDIIKWSIIGFLGLISASFIINLIVRVIYSFN
ncbi:MAG: hypothetical protein PHV23_05690 [Candidatus Gracilibacteria bacterium]|nr:hypothetical protein [Candidatus Gracilibacteria bacterium]